MVIILLNKYIEVHNWSNLNENATDFTKKHNFAIVLESPEQFARDHFKILEINYNNMFISCVARILL